MQCLQKMIDAIEVVLNFQLNDCCGINIKNIIGNFHFHRGNNIVFQNYFNYRTKATQVSCLRMENLFFFTKSPYSSSLPIGVLILSVQILKSSIFIKSAYKIILSFAH